MKTTTATILTVAAALCSGSVFGGPEKDPANKAAPVAEPGGAKGAPVIATVDDLLAAVEGADRGLTTLAADIQYDRRMKLQGDQHVRRGKLFFRAEPSASNPNKMKRSFGIGFTTLFIGDRRENDSQFWIFDGEWLVEKHPEEKMFVKRRIAAPGADFDPLRIGEGPMPIPIGQKAADIRARFEVEMPPAGDIFEPGAVLADFVKDAHQLRLVPKPAEHAAAEFIEIRLWYRWDDASQRMLPRLARTAAINGDESYVQLLNVAVNGPVDARVFDVSPPKDVEGWDVQVIEELPERAAAQAGDGGGAGAGATDGAAGGR